MSAINLGPVLKTVDGETISGSRYRQATGISISGREYQSALEYVVKLMVHKFDQYEAAEGEKPLVENQSAKKYRFPVTYLIDHPKFAQVMADFQELIYFGIAKKDAEEALIDEDAE